MIAVTASELERQPGGPYRFDRWIAKRSIPSPLGAFSIDLNMLGNGDTNPPDSEMLRRASELVAYLESHAEYILDIVFGHYLFASQEDGWLEFNEVPRGLGRQSVTEYLQTRSLVVSRRLDWNEPYSSAIFVVPKWEQEHALILGFRDGAITTLNDMKFRLESGVLRWEDG